MHLDTLLLPLILTLPATLANTLATGMHTTTGSLTTTTTTNPHPIFPPPSYRCGPTKPPAPRYGEIRIASINLFRRAEPSWRECAQIGNLNRSRSCAIIENYATARIVLCGPFGVKVDCMKMADTVDELASRCMVDGRMQREVLVGGGVKFVVMSSRSRMVPVIGWEA